MSDKQIRLSTVDQKSYTEKYQLLVKKQVPIKFKTLNGVLQQQFALTAEESKIIIKMVYSLVKADINKDNLDQNGFFLVLKYVQCLQNNFDLNKLGTVDIYQVLLPNKLKVQKKKTKQQQKLEEIEEGKFVQFLQLSLVSQTQEFTTSFDDKFMYQSSLISSTINEFTFQPNGNNFAPTPSFNPSSLRFAPPQTDSIQYDHSCYNVQVDMPTVKVNIDENDQSGENPFQSLEEFKEEKKDSDIQLRQFESKIIPQNSQNSSDGPEQERKISDVENKEQNKTIDTQQQWIDETENDSIEKEIEWDKIQMEPFKYIKDGYFSGYYSSKIISTYKNLKENENNEIIRSEVSRRYNDFDMFSSYLENKFMGHMFPKLPPKESTITNLSKRFKEPTEELEQRRKMLEEYLLYLKDHGMFSQDKLLIRFLTVDKKFEEILNQFKQERAEKSTSDEIEFEDDDAIPDPQQYTLMSKMMTSFRKMGDVNLAQISEGLSFGYFSQNKELDAHFKEQFKTLEDNLNGVKNKQRDIMNLENNLASFFKPIEFKQENEIRVSESEYSILSADMIKSFGKLQQDFTSTLQKQQSIHLTLQQKIRLILRYIEFIQHSFFKLKESILLWQSQKIQLQYQQGQAEQLKRKIEKEEDILAKSVETLNKDLQTLNQGIKNRLEDILKELNQGLAESQAMIQP